MIGDLPWLPPQRKRFQSLAPEYAATATQLKNDCVHVVTPLRKTSWGNILMFRVSPLYFFPLMASINPTMLSAPSSSSTLTLAHICQIIEMILNENCTARNAKKGSL